MYIENRAIEHTRKLAIIVYMLITTTYISTKKSVLNKHYNYSYVDNNNNIMYIIMCVL